MPRQSMPVGRELELAREQTLPRRSALPEDNRIEHLKILFTHVEHILLIQEAGEIQIAFGKKTPAHAFDIGDIARGHLFEILRGEWYGHTIGKIIWLSTRWRSGDHKNDRFD